MQSKQSNISKYVLLTYHNLHSYKNDTQWKQFTNDAILSPSSNWKRPSTNNAMITNDLHVISRRPLVMTDVTVAYCSFIKNKNISSDYCIVVVTA